MKISALINMKTFSIDVRLIFFGSNFQQNETSMENKHYRIIIKPHLGTNSCKCL